LRASELSAFPLGTLFGSFFPCRKKELPAAQAKGYCATELRCKYGQAEIFVLQIVETYSLRSLMPQAANCSFCCFTVYSSMTRLCPGNRRFFLFLACAHAARAVTFCCSTKSNQKGNQRGRPQPLARKWPRPFGIPITTPHCLRPQVPLSVTAAPCQPLTAAVPFCRFATFPPHRGGIVPRRGATRLRRCFLNRLPLMRNSATHLLHTNEQRRSRVLPPLGEACFVWRFYAPGLFSLLCIGLPSFPAH
jgi:hypothetical protein